MEYSFIKLNRKIDKITNLAKKIKKEINSLDEMIKDMENDNIQYDHKEFIVLSAKAKELDKLLSTVK